MLIALFWLLLPLLFALAVRLGHRLGIVPIVSQLALAATVLPAIVLLWFEPHWQLSAAQLLAPLWLELAYGLSFALLLGYILADVVDLQLSAQSLKIALPSFLVPFACGLAVANWVLELHWLSSVALGLLFAITAIPVLYLYLRNIGYPAAAIRRLMHAAVLMDLISWCLFALAQGSTQWTTLVWPLIAALLPMVLRWLKLRHALCYSLPFFLLMVLLHHLQLNALVFGILYLLCLAMLRQPFRLPLPSALWQRLQNGFAIPLILTCGVLQVNFAGVWQGYDWRHFSALLILPVISKVAGNWLGLYWADRRMPSADKWRESVLLNIRGLTEIVFLNLLLQQQLVDPLVYFSLLLMSLFSTLLPAMLGIRQGPIHSFVESRNDQGIRES